MSCTQTCLWGWQRGKSYRWVKESQPWSDRPAAGQGRGSQLPALLPPSWACSPSAGYGGAYSGYYGNGAYDYYGSASGYAGQGGAAPADPATAAAAAAAAGDRATQATASEPAAAAAAAEGKESEVKGSEAQGDEPTAPPEPPVLVEVPLKQKEAATEAGPAAAAGSEPQAEPVAAPTAEELEQAIREKLAAVGVANGNGSPAGKGHEEAPNGQQKQVGWGGTRQCSCGLTVKAWVCPTAVGAACFQHAMPDIMLSQSPP